MLDVQTKEKRRNKTKKRKQRLLLVATHHFHSMGEITLARYPDEYKIRIAEIPLGALTPQENI